MYHPKIVFVDLLLSLELSYLCDRITVTNVWLQSVTLLHAGNLVTRWQPCYMPATLLHAGNLHHSPFLSIEDKGCNLRQTNIYFNKTCRKVKHFPNTLMVFVYEKLSLRQVQQPQIETCNWSPM